MSTESSVHLLRRQAFSQAQIMQGPIAVLIAGAHDHPVHRVADLPRRARRAALRRRWLTL